MTRPEAVETTRFHRVAGRTDGRTALVTTRPCHGGLCDSIAIGTGNGSDGEAGRRTASYTNDVPDSVDLHRLVALAMRVASARA
jgi:hypothetical protein